MAERVVIIGTGQAGAQVAISLRQQGFEGEIVLVGEEPDPPYQRPPLSKKLLTGEMAVERTYLRSPEFWPKHSVRLLAGVRARAIDRDARTVILEGSDPLAYDALVLCTGTRARRLGLPGENLGGVLELRTLADAHRIREAARPGARAVIIGGGYIGLEVGASLHKLGCAVTVLEAQERVLKRVAAAPVSAFFAAEHARQGVAIETDAAVVALEGKDRVRAVISADGRALPADLVVIGVGAVPNDELARTAGLEIADGVVVDAAGRTSDPHIFAAGDVTQHLNPFAGRVVRLESVHNAQVQGKAVAAAIAGHAPPEPEVPWFWSDQYDLKLQIAGISSPEVDHLIRGDPGARSFSCLHLLDDRLVAIDAVNRPGDFLAAKRLIKEARPVDRARAVDIEVPLGDL